MKDQLLEALVRQRSFNYYYLSINFSEANTKLCLAFLYYNTDNSYLLVNGKEILNLKPTIEILTFQLNIVLEVYLMDLMLVNLDKYLQIESSLIFEPITILVIDLTYYACASI